MCRRVISSKEGGIESAVGVEPGQSRTMCSIIILEATRYQDLSVGLYGDVRELAVETRGRHESRVARAVIVESGYPTAYNRTSKKVSGNDDPPVGLKGERINVPAGRV